MKRLEISRLMDEYTDTEFFPEGGSAAGTQAVKERVLANVKAPARGVRKPVWKTALLAAVLAAVLVVLVGAGFPYVQYWLTSGALSFDQASDGWIISFIHDGPVVELKNGRLFFNPADGPRVDITDFISEEVPYICDGSRPDENVTYYIIIGGTPDCYGYLEWVTAPTPPNFWDDYWDGPAPAWVLDENGRGVASLYNFQTMAGKHSTGSLAFPASNVSVSPEMELPWLLAGMDELGIPYEYEAENSG